MKIIALILMSSLGAGGALAQPPANAVRKPVLPPGAWLACDDTGQMAGKHHARDSFNTWVSYASRESVASTARFYQDHFKKQGTKQALGTFVGEPPDQLAYTVVAPTNNSVLLGCLADRSGIVSVILVRRTHSAPTRQP